MKEILVTCAAFLRRFVPSGWILLILFAVGCGDAIATQRSWTNSLGGSWFDASNWSPNGVPGASDAASITVDGTYTVLVPTGSVSTVVINLGGGSGKQTLVYGTTTAALFITNSSVHANGILVVTNGGLRGNLLVESGGELQINAPFGLFFYNFALTNQGTVTWSSGSPSVGGSNDETTTIVNSGLLEIIGDNNLNYGGGSRPMLINSGTVRKTLAAGTSIIGMDLINLPSGVVDVSSGAIQFAAFGTNVLGGSFTATQPGQIKFRGNQTDAGGIGSGSGLIQFLNGTFYLRTNAVPHLALVGGDVYVHPTTFQQAGTITNLTLDGAYLRGTNRLAGTLTINAGSLPENLTVRPGAQLELAAPGGGSLAYSSTLVNEGTVLWSGGPIGVGGTPPTVISNAGTWTITGDASFNYGGGIFPYFTNYGTVQKTGGSGVSSLGGITFLNQPSGIIRVDSGTLQMANNYIHTAGTLRLNGGTLTCFGTLGMTDGQLDGSGTIGAAAAFDGGTISPGSSPGLIQFKSGLTLGANAKLVIEGTGTTPGSQYDQLSVNGPLALNGCTLEISSLPTVPVGTGFVIINNISSNPGSGSFNGMPDNSRFTIGSQLFRIHYNGGGGNDVVLARDALAGPQLFAGGYTNSAFQVLGLGSASGIYTIQASTNFLQWTNVASVTADIGGHFSFIDTNASKFSRRFYRTGD